MAGGSIKVSKDVTGSLVVTITRSSAGSLTVYSDAALTTSVSMPDSITASKTYYLANDDLYVISVTRNGIEIANTPNGTLTTWITEGKALSISPLVDYVNVEAGTEGADLAADNAFSGTNTFSGRTRIAAGTALLPSITPTGDTNTGWWAPAADVVATSAGGAEITRTNASGFGILKTPTVPLDVLGAAAVSGTLTAGALTATNAVTAASAAITGAVTHGAGAVGTPSVTTTGDLDTGVWFPAANTIAASVNGAEGLRLTTTGLGIGGVAAPLDDLHVEGNTDTGVRIVQNTDDAVGGHLYFRKRRGTSASPTVALSGDDAGAFYFQAYDSAANRTIASIGAAVDGTMGSGDAPGRLIFYTTPDGSATSTERMRIDNAGLITGSGSLGAWTTYTPTLAGTGWAIGDGVVIATYNIIGKNVHFHIKITAGASTTFGGASAPTLTLPTTPLASGGNAWNLQGRFTDTSAGAAYGAVVTSSGATATMGSPGVLGLFTAVTATSPFVWTTSDIIELFGTYETT